MLSLVAPLLLTAAAAATTRRSESNGCNVLSDNVPNTIFFRGDDVYEYENTRFWSNNEIMDPECVFRPSSADEVAQAVQIMQDTNTQFAVRGGGHMAIRVRAILYTDVSWHDFMVHGYQTLQDAVSSSSPWLPRIAVAILRESHVSQHVSTQS